MFDSNKDKPAKRFVAALTNQRVGAHMFDVIVDTETHVQYLMPIAGGVDNGMVALLDADGKPLLYTGELADK